MTTLALVERTRWRALGGLDSLRSMRPRAYGVVSIRHRFCLDRAFEGAGTIDALMIFLQAGLSWFTLRTRHS